MKALRSFHLLGTIAVLTALLFLGCANPSIHRVDAQRLAESQIRTVFVPRFEGNPNFVEEATDLFIATLESRSDVRIVQGGPLRSEGPDIHSGSNLVATEIAVLAAKQRGADAVIVGKVTSHHTGATLNGFSTIRLISVRDGDIVASFHRPSGLLIGHSEHQAVMAAVRRTAEDTAETLKDARGARR